jgi:periplasmic copper chaperone A
MRRSTLLRAGVAVVATGFATLGFAGPASAHVTVSSASAVQGGYTKVTFRIPNEKDNASTTKVEVVLPEGQPIASVSVKPVVGWIANPEKSKLATPIKTDDGEITEAITKITWTADANSAIKPGQFQEFDVSLGPLPKVDQLVFKALQTYSDGEIVRWIEEPSSGVEAEHPAPVLKLAKSAADATNTGSSVSSGSSGSSDGNGAAVGLAIAGLVLGLAGLVLGALAYRKATSRAS